MSSTPRGQFVRRLLERLGSETRAGVFVTASALASLGGRIKGDGNNRYNKEPKDEHGVGSGIAGGVKIIGAKK